MSDIDCRDIIGMSPHMSIYMDDRNRLLLLSEQRSYRLSGQLYHDLMPLLDGTRTIDGILAAVSDRFAPDRVRDVLADMLRKGYLARLDPSAPRQRQALWSETGLSPADAEQALRSLPVHVMPVGDDAAADAALLRAALADAGFALADDTSARLTIVAVDDYLRRDLVGLNRVMRGQGRTWTLFKAGGTRPMFGPVFSADNPRCWHCLSLRMIEHRPGDGAVPGNVAAVRPARAGHMTSRTAFAGLVALQLARATASEGLGRFGDAILGLDLATLEWQRHHVRPYPECPVCGDPVDAQAQLQRALRPLELRSPSILGDGSDGWRTRPAAEVLERLERYVSPVTGLIADVEDCSLAPGLCVFKARQTYPAGVTLQQNRLAGQPGAAAGKGTSPLQARVSCLAEAVERYACGDNGTSARRRATWADIGDDAVHPAALVHFSARQFATRETWNARNEAFNWIAEPFDDARAVEWTPAWSLTHGRTRWLPSRFCFFNYIDPDRSAGRPNVFCAADSNGCASGSTLEEAILQGFLELAERDACALWWYNRLRRPAFDLDALESPFVNQVRADCGRGGRELTVLDLTNDLGIPTAVAVAHDRADGGRIHVGLGAHLDAGAAVSRALTEMVQFWAIERCENLLAAPNPTADEPVFRKWLRDCTLDTEPYCVPDGVTDVRAYPVPRRTDLKDAIEYCVRLMADRGLETIVLDHSRPDIDFAVARVVVPGLRHFWARLAPGRLYDVPVSLGWMDRPLDETTLNPIPFFL